MLRNPDFVTCNHKCNVVNFNWKWCVLSWFRCNIVRGIAWSHYIVTNESAYLMTDVELFNLSLRLMVSTKIGSVPVSFGYISLATNQAANIRLLEVSGGSSTCHKSEKLRIVSSERTLPVYLYIYWNSTCHVGVWMKFIFSATLVDGWKLLLLLELK